MLDAPPQPVSEMAHVAQVKHAEEHRWHKLWLKLSSPDRVWYRQTAKCESHNNPHINTGNGYYGAVQWLVSTWHAAGGKGMPHHTGRYQQGVRGVRWMHSAGRGQWPVCG